MLISLKLRQKSRVLRKTPRGRSYESALRRTGYSNVVVSLHRLFDWLHSVFRMNFSGFLCDLQIMLMLEPAPMLA